MKQLVVGAVIVGDLDAPKTVLAARRTTPPSLRGRWEFPGGKVEPGEEPEAALVRELKEELGIRVVLGQELLAPEGRTWHISDDLEMRLWFAVIEHGVPAPVDSHDELTWLDVNTLTSVDWLDADRKILPHVFGGKSCLSQ